MPAYQEARVQDSGMLNTVSPHKQVFIIGSRRSGTTWTLWLLSNHPSMVGVQHTNLVDSFKRVNEWWLDEDPYHNSIVSGQSEKNKTTLKEFITSDDFYSECSGIMSMVFSKAFKEKPEASVVVESQPENIDNLDFLVKLYPNAYYLHVIRDPRSVFSSWKSIASTWSSPDIFKTHPVGFAERWRRDISEGRSFSNKIKHYKEIKYEELKSDGSDVLKGVFEWLGVSASDDVAKNAIDACEIQKLRKKGNMPKGFFRKGLAEGWKSELSKKEIRMVEYLLSDLMTETGYEKSVSNTTEPLGLKVYYLKKNLLTGLKNTAVYDLLRKIKRRLLGG